MNCPCLIESGLQVFTRLTCPPTLVSLHPHLFPDGPLPLQVIEISYENDSPQNAILCDLISNVILPAEYGGKNTSVVIIITDGHFDVLILAKILRFKLKLRFNYDEDSIKSIVEKCLNLAYIMEVYDSRHLFITMKSVEQMFAAKAEIAMVIVDTISAFYWSDRLNGKSVFKMDSYLKKTLGTLQALTKEYKPVIVYTKPSYFVSKSSLSDEGVECSQEIGIEKINYKLIIKKNSEQKGVTDLYNVSVKDVNCTFLKHFYFKSDEINWV